LERTEYIGRNSAADLSQRDDNGLYPYLFIPSLAEALDHLQPEKALTLFEKEDLELLQKRATALRYLLGGSAPFYSLSELEQLTKLFILYLARNRDHILKTGLPEQSFEKSPLLETLLSPLYFVKKPISSHIAESNENGDAFYQYIWGSGNDGSSIKECTYDEAPILEVLTPAEARYLIKNRGKLFVLKIQVLRELLESLQSGEKTNLVNKSLRLLTKIYDEKELESYVNTDNAYIEANIYPRGNPTVWHRPVTGGITDLLEIIGHYQKELSIGTFAKTKEALGKVISFDRLMCAPSNGSEIISSYFKYVALGVKEELDIALDLFFSLQAEEENYWSVYRSGVQLLLKISREGYGSKCSEDDEPWLSEDVTEEEILLKDDELWLGEDVTEEIIFCECEAEAPLLKEEIVDLEPSIQTVAYKTTVATEYADVLQKNLHYFAELFKWHIENTGRPPEPPQLHSLVIPTKPENVFRKEVEIWRITFQGDSIALKDTKGLRYIAYLLSTPEKECHVFDLIAAVDGVPAEATNDIYSRMSQKQLEKEHNLTSSFLEDAGDILDTQAKEEIQERLRGLNEDLAEAERNNDLGLMSKYKEEIESLKSYISQAYSTNKGRSRKAADPEDKARKAVYNSITRSLNKIKHDHPSLWRHLDNAIHTGVFCSYNPENGIDWSL
jgi:hypothetical protein